MNASADRMPQPTFGDAAAAFGAIHADTASLPFASNLDTQVALLRAGETTLPATINHGEPHNAWICSPLSTYCNYALEELERNVHPLLAQPLRFVCHSYGHLLRRANIDRAVALNNWLLSTNLYPRLVEAEVRTLVASARRRWPDHALWFRSLNATMNRDWIDALTRLGFQLIPSRQVYLFDDIRRNARCHQNLARDLHLLRDTPLQKVHNGEVMEADYPRIAELYAMLYLEKYSRLNPQYSALFMRRWHVAGLLQFKGLRAADGALQAVVGMFRQGQTITAPIVGYDTAAPQSLGLYRLLMASVFEEAMTTGSMINLSAGAANFKRLRGGQPAIEYSAVLASHLPAGTRRVVSVLSTLTTKIGVPVMQRFKL
jgi:hypothetical protein